ncbi:HAMP domain-containing histidine kinase, partial [bacterium]|nr:HAMP domain-containing histidine kinase [bacterium]
GEHGSQARLRLVLAGRRRCVWRPSGLGQPGLGRRLAVLAGVVGGYNLVFSILDYLLRRTLVTREKNIAFAWLQLVTDLFGLSWLVHLTGGINSALVIFYVIHLVVVSELMRRWHSFAIAGLTCILLDAVVALEMSGVLIHYHYPGFSLGADFSMPALGGRAALSCLVVNTAFFVTVHVASSISGRLREREAQIEHFNTELMAVNEAKSQFMRITSHEMRSPLQAIKGLLSLYQKKTMEVSIDPEYRDLLDRCNRRLTSVSQLIDDLLQYSRLQSVSIEDEIHSVALLEILDTALEEFQPVAQTKEIHLAVEKNPCEVFGDSEQILTLVRNLISNALRYTPATGTVWISLSGNGTESVLRVRDSGIGIDPDSVRYVFDEFYRAPEAKQHEPGGTGLGLTLCKRIVERHQGRIILESSPGQGTLFEIHLPRGSAPQSAGSPLPS